MEKRLIIDYTLYNGDPIAELRLKYLYPVVDYFVIVEARQTFRGGHKEQLYLDKYSHIFEPYQDKIIKVIVDIAGNCADWVKEASQREQGQRYISENFKDKEYIVLACDMDEIPNHKFINNIWQYYDKCDKGLHIKMDVLLYGFRWLEKDANWKMPFIISDKGINSNSFHAIRETIIHNPNQEFVDDAGWHVTYCLNMNDMCRKLESYCHRECDRVEFKKKDYIRLCILTGRVFYNFNNKKLQYYNGNNLPDGWYDFQEKMDNDIFEEGIKEFR